MDDRFDRRELLLHLGDMLEAASCATKAGRPDAPVSDLATREESLQDFAFLQALEPQMTVAEFAGRVASAYFLWPKELLEPSLNRNALASTVQHDLFEDNPGGWATYAAHVQKKVSWFGKTLPVENLGAPTRAVRTSAVTKPKTGWPWTPASSQ
jgi:hypothetical protein